MTSGERSRPLVQVASWVMPPPLLAAELATDVLLVAVGETATLPPTWIPPPWLSGAAGSSLTTATLLVAAGQGA